MPTWPEVTLDTGETVRLVTAHLCQHLRWATARTTNGAWLKVRPDGATWRRLTAVEQSWLKHKDDWMRYV